MRVIIAGSRSIDDYSLVVNSIKESGFIIAEIISGGANGVDKLGEQYAKDHNIPLTVYPADWSKGKSAGPIRNTKMAQNADALILIWDAKSKGSADMFKKAEANKLKIYMAITR